MVSFVKSMFLLLFFSISLTQCKTSQSMPTISKVVSANSDVYFQSWVAGVRGGGSGTNLFISKSLISPNKPVSVYFRNKSINFEVLNFVNDFYIARFKGDANQLSDYNMNLDGTKEYGNEVPSDLKKTFPFELTNNEAVLSYDEAGKLKYIKITGILQKESVPYPVAPRK